MNMQDILVNSVIEKKVLDIEYHQELRRVEVHAIGSNKKGDVILRVYQTMGGSVFSGTEGWKLLKLSDIEAIHTTNESFSEPRQGYKQNDSAMVEIISQV